MILECTRCREAQSPAAKYQTDKYGLGMRVHNPCRPKEKEPVARCTVCGAERLVRRGMASG